MMYGAVIALAALSACRSTQSLGDLGDASPADVVDAPVDRPDELTWRYGSVAAGGLRSCATVAGYAWCWGSPWSGALGRELNAPTPTPLLVAGVEAVERIAMGDRFSCALALGGAWCWGENGAGQLGVEGAARAHPERVAGVADVRAIVAGGQTACARSGDAAWWCWGALAQGAPHELDALRGASSVALGAAHLCGLWPERGGGRVRCRGDNTAGQLGDGTTDDRAALVDATGDDGAPLATASDLSASGFNTCALVGDRRQVRCWGSLTALPVVTLRADEALRAIGVGDEHVCALTEAGRAVCWGRNAKAQLGDDSTAPSTDDRLRPVALPAEVRLSAISVGLRHTCAAELSGEALWCWGFNASGQLGGGDLDPHRTPVRIDLPGR